MVAQKDYTTIFGRIVLSKFDSMPEWARLCAFFVALFVLTYVALHSLNAKYFVGGTVLEPSPNHPGSNQLARGYDVRWADNYAGTNSKGHYVFVLSPLEYFSLLKAGNHSLEIWKSGDKDDVEAQEICQKSINFERLASRFEDYHIDKKCLVNEQAVAPILPAEFPREYSLVPTTYAALSSTPDADYRMLVRTLRVDSKWPRSDSAEIMLFQNGYNSPLLNLSGSLYGGVSILPGESFAFTDGVYLPARSLSGGRLRLSHKGGLFGSYIEEWFELPSRMEIGKQFSSTGSLGSDLNLIPIGPSTITVYRKDGDADYYPRLAQDLLSAGVLTLSSASPMGADKTTNTLYIGSTVGPSTVKSVVGAIVKNGLNLKRIAYPYKFVSTLDTFRMQLGWSRQCVDAALIPQSELARLMVTSDEQVQAFLARFNECKPH